MADDVYTRETKKYWDEKSIRRWTDMDGDLPGLIVEVAYSNPALYRQRDVEHNPDDPTEFLVGVAQRLDEEQEDIEVNRGQLEYALQGHGSGLEPEQQILE